MFIVCFSNEQTELINTALQSKSVKCNIFRIYLLLLLLLLLSSSSLSL